MGERHGAEYKIHSLTCTYTYTYQRVEQKKKNNEKRLRVKRYITPFVHLSRPVRSADGRKEIKNDFH